MKSIQIEDTRTYAEKRKAIRMRERLIELLDECPCGNEVEIKSLGSCSDRKYGMCGEVDRLSYCVLQHLADHLIANGVTVEFKKPPVDLAGKCGSCAYAKDECPSVYVRCTNPEHIAKYFRSKDKSLRQRTTPACRQYKPKEGA